MKTNFLQIYLVLFALSNPAFARLNAGPDVWTCCLDWKGLSGTSQGITDYEWKSLTGTGTFSNKNSLTSKYYFSLNEINSGLATLRFFSKSNPTIYDDVNIHISAPLPKLSAGVDLTLTLSQNSKKIFGAQNGITAFEWTSSGTGTFDNRNIIQPTYTPSAQDKNIGRVTLKVKSKNSATVYDEMILNIQNCNYTLDILADKDVVCGFPYGGNEFNLSANMNSSFFPSTDFSYQWSSNGESDNFSNPNEKVTTYNSTPSDYISRQAIVSVVATHKSGLCPSKSAYKTLFINEPIQDVTDITNLQSNICYDQEEYILNISLLGPVSQVFTISSGTGYFSSTYNYVLSESDRYEDFLEFSYYTNDPSGPCTAVGGNFSVSIISKPLDIEVSNSLDCENAIISLDAMGIYKNRSERLNVQWTSNGSGFFTNNFYTNFNEYYVSEQDFQRGYVDITVTDPTCGINSKSFNKTIRIDLSSCRNRSNLKVQPESNYSVSLVSKNKIRINGIQAKTNVQILDANGKKMPFTIDGDNNFILPNATSGVYFINIYDGSKNQFFKLML